MSAVTLSYQGAVAMLTLSNEAKLNALTTTMLTQLDDALAALEPNANIRAVILTGSGARAFCCGADIAEWGPMSPQVFARDWVRFGHRVFDRLARLSKPTIGALNGHAFGGGLELAACCDVRVMTPRARLALPEGKIGIVPGWSGTQRLARLLPEPVIKELALFGVQLSAERALGFGFVADVSDDALARANEIADGLVEMSPSANGFAKAMIHAAVGEDSQAAIEALGSAAAAASADRSEGVEAFLNKRTPQFSGQ